MAATEDEDSQNQSKKDDHFFNSKRKQFSTMQQDFENKLLRTGVTYETQVGTILTGWDLTGASSVAQLPFANFLYSWTLKLVLQGEWPKLEKIVKTRLGAMLQRCTRDPLLEPMCRKLIPLVTDPWGHPTLKAIVAGSDVLVDDVREYIELESWEIIRTRIDTMITSRCEELALSLLKACMKCMNHQSSQHSVGSPHHAKLDHTYFIDLYFVLLYKYHRKQFLEKVKELNVEDGVNLVRRLLAQQEKAKVWKHRLKIAEIIIQFVLASCSVKPYNDLFRLVFSEWCSVMKTINTSTNELISMTRKYIQLAESSRHIYSMASLLHHEFGDCHAALITELLIGALTRDLNSLERVRSNNENADTRRNEELEIQHQMATGFMYLSSVFDKYETIARECVLTAFSLHPTIERLGIIRRFAANDAAPPINSFAMNFKTEPCLQYSSFSPDVNSSSSDMTGGQVKWERKQVVAVSTCSTPDFITQPILNEYGEAKHDGMLCNQDVGWGSTLPSLNVFGDGVQEYKVKEEVDSMDGFIANTEGLIEQLHNKSSPHEDVMKCDIFKSPQKLLNVETLGISSELCDDLAVVLSSPRWQILSWLLDKGDLLHICDQYLRDSERAKNITKELKYLKVDYEQFKHLPSSRDNFGGIEKGYEHFVQLSSDESEIYDSQGKSGFSSNSEAEIIKQKKAKAHRDRKYKRSMKKRVTDSDSAVNCRSVCGTTTTTTSMSESEETDLEYTRYKGLAEEKSFEGKRVTAVSNNDRRKRLRIDAITGRVRSLRAPKCLVNDLRLYRHMFQNESKNYAPSLGTINLSPSVIISGKDQSKIKVEDDNHNKISEGDREHTYDDCTAFSDMPKINIAAEKFTMKPHNDDATPAVESKAHMLSELKYKGNIWNKNKSHVQIKVPTPECQNAVSVDDRSMQWSKFQESYAKFLIQNQLRILQTDKKKRKEKGRLHLDKNKHRKEMLPHRSTLSQAQKNILHTLMHPDPKQQVIAPLNTIAMPVSHNPPNLPPNKGPPAGLSRSLPKGTTVVRRPRNDGAGPSGLNNGGTTVSVLARSSLSHTGSQPRPALSITPSFSSQVDCFSSTATSSRGSVVRSQVNSNIDSNVNFQNEVNSLPPLASAAVAVAITPTSQSCNIVTSPGEIQSGFSNGSSDIASSVSFIATPTTSSTVARSLGEPRSTSMLESLLRDQGGSHSFSSSNRNSPSGCATSFCESILASSVCTSVPSSLTTDVYSPISVTTHSTIGTSMQNISDNRCSTMDKSVEAEGNFSLDSPTSSFGSSSVFATASTSRNLPSDSGSSSNILEASVVTTSAPGCVSQYLLPAHLIQVQVGDGSTSLGLVPSTPLDFRIPPGTRVIKPNSTVTSAGAVPITHSSTRQSNVLHNVKIVQNRPVVRALVVPHSVALQSLGNHQTAQIVALNQSSLATSESESQHHATKLQSTQLQKLLGHNMVPGSLVIRAVRPSADVTDGNLNLNPCDVIKSENQEKVKQPSTDVMSDRLGRHSIKASLLATSTTQSVGTQTQTTAVKPVTGQTVSHGLMNSLRASSHSPGISSTPVVSHVESSQPSSAAMTPLNLTSNAVSSEALKQLGEFESVFEKVSNKSIKKENDTDCCAETFPAAISSEESMIAAQLLNMANEPTVSTNQNFSPGESESPDVSAAVTGTSNTNVDNPVSIATPSSNLGENAFITTQAGTLILVNPAATGPGIVTLSGGVQATQPPPAASPALSSTSSQSSIASSSSTSSKSKKHSSEPKIITPSSTPVPKPKSPPPPKVPPKPAITKPQVEESDEIKAKIQSILDQYKQDLANNPQPQPAPRNRKNCPPPKSEGKSSGKKKSQMKKPDGTSTSSPGSIESHLQSVSSSPANLSVSTAGEDSDSSVGGPSVTPSRFSQDEKPKAEEANSSPQLLQGVVLSNVKVDGSTGLTNFPSTVAGGRVFQLIRHGNGKVTAITTQQPYNKSKIGLNQGGPPPNVTIQGRINVSDLMESQLASLITGGTVAVTAGNSLITKLVQAQNNSVIHQLILQDSGQQNEQVVQQVAVQSVLQPQSKLPAQSEEVLSVATESSNSSQKLVEPTQPLLPSASMDITQAPGTAHKQIDSPSSEGCSPAFNDESSNGSEQSSVPSGPLPPFFTLTKQFMTPAQSGQRDKTASASGSIKNSPPNSKAESSKTNPKVRVEGPNKPIVQAVYCGSSEIRSSLPAKVGECMQEMSPASQSSLESSAILNLNTSVHGSYDLRSSNSLDSIKSGLSTEEEQAPSPATLTKQLQNAYMSEAALSPVIAQSQLSSNSCYPSPAAITDMHFSETHKAAHLSPGLEASRRYSQAGTSRPPNSVSGCSNNLSCSNGIEVGALACLSSPSGDVYLDQASVGLNLDNIALVESHSQSPRLSDLVQPGPLLSWSPRSADSMIGHSPSLNDALSTNIALETQNSEDSLCDSSTSFPALFSIEGDAASVSSSTSEEFSMTAGSNTSPSLIRNSRPYQSHLLTSQNRQRQTLSREQDHTVSSTRMESNNEQMSCIPGDYPCLMSSDSKDDASTESSESEWKFKCKNKYDRKTSAFVNKKTNEGASTSCGIPKCDQKSHSSKVDEEMMINRRRSQRQIDVMLKKDNSGDKVTYNGFEREKSGACSSDEASSNLKPTKFRKVLQLCGVGGEIKLENASECANSEVKLKTEVKEELSQRVTRGAKRRSEDSIGGIEKKGKFLRSGKELPKQEDEERSEYSGRTSRITRSRHVSGTSDSSSSYSMDRVSTPGLQDSPMSSTNGGGGLRRKKRGGSHDSSISSRDGSPLTILQNAYQEYGSPNIMMSTRRSSSREQAKKTRCACCIDQQPGQTGLAHSSSNSSRRSIGKPRGSGSSS